MFFKMLRNNRGEVGPKKDEEEAQPDPALDESHLNPGEEPDEEDDGSLEIDLDDDGSQEEEDTRHPAEIRLDQEKKELKEMNQNLQRQIEELNQKITPAQAPVTTPGDPNDPMNWTKEQWDELATTDWQKAVDLRAEIKARQIQETVNTNTQFNDAQEKSKQTVLSRHPELNDVNSEKAKIFKNIVTANPEYIHSKKGPEMAMYEMENYMEQHMGYKREEIVKAEQAARRDEAERGNRVALTSTVGRNVSSGNKVILTKADREFCELQGIDPKQFAANKKQLEKSGRGGIQL
jgi:hypothetical protein